MTTDTPPRATEDPPDLAAVLNETGAAPPPRKERADKGQKRGPRGPRKGKCSKILTELTATVGAFVGLVDEFDGSVLVNNATKLGEAWGPIADKNVRVRTFLTRLESGGLYGGAIVVTLAVAIPIAAHHKLLPPEFEKLGRLLSGMPSPTTMNAEGKPSSGTAVPGAQGTPDYGIPVTPFDGA